MNNTKAIVENTKKEKIKSAVFATALNIGYYSMLSYYIYRTFFI